MEQETGKCRKCGVEAPLIAWGKKFLTDCRCGQYEYSPPPATDPAPIAPARLGFRGYHGYRAVEIVADLGVGERESAGFLGTGAGKYQARLVKVRDENGAEWEAWDTDVSTGRG